MKELLNKIRNTKGCKVFASNGMPILDKSLNLPLDLQAFYSLCGGVELFKGADYPFNICTPEEFVLANPAIMYEGYEEHIPESDISNYWYIIATSGPEQSISIDLTEKNNGLCYDSFWDIHASEDSPIIAQSFSSLLTNLFQGGGSYPYWLSDSFQSLGNAYE